MKFIEIKAAKAVSIMGLKIMNKIKQLGNKAVFADTPSKAVLEKVKNPHSDKFMLVA